MNTRSHVGLTLVTGACLVLVASPAAAHSDDGHHPREDVVEQGEWAPTPAEYYAPTDSAACGDTITIVGGDVRAGEERTSKLRDGSTLVEFRGRVTMDLTRKSDGATIDELDISGPGWTVISADGTQVEDVLFGPSLLFPITEDDGEKFIEQFGSDLVYFDDPRESVGFEATVVPETSALVEFRSVDIDAHLVDLCRWFDRDGHHGQDRHHDRGHHDGDGRKHHHRS